MITPRLYTIKEGADRLQRSEDWYLKQIKARRLPARKVGRFWRVSEEDIQAAIDSFAVPAFAPVKDPSGLSSRSRRRLRGGDAA